MTTERQEAITRADARNDWYVWVSPAKAVLGPVSEHGANQGVKDALAAGFMPKKLRVVEDYEA